MLVEEQLDDMLSKVELNYDLQGEAHEILLESKCLNVNEEGHETTGFFPHGFDVLAHTPSPRCDTHKEYCHLPSHQDEGAH